MVIFKTEPLRNTCMKLTKLFIIYFVLLSLQFRITNSQETWRATSFNNVPAARTMHTAVWTGSKMIIWGGQSNYVDINTGGQYDVAANSWTPTSTINAPVGRELHSAIWTGSKMIVWGGWWANDTSIIFLNSGGIYDPVLDSWIQTSTINAPPTRRTHHNAVWTGSKMIVWGGFDTISGFTNTGGIYDPDSDTWTEMSTVNAPDGRDWFTAIWTGSKMIIWGGEAMVGGQQGPVNTGGIFDPALNSWTPTSLVSAPLAREEHSAIWTGNKMVIWGGAGYGFETEKSGGIYDPVSDSWSQISTNNAPPGSFVLAAIWTGTKMIVWGGLDTNADLINTGGIYDPVTDNWAATTQSSAPFARAMHTAVWTGTKMIIWGGNGIYSPLNSGGIYSNSAVIEIQNTDISLPKSFNLSQNYPNPFNPTTTIKFDLPKDANVTIQIFDMIGRVVDVLAKNEFKRASSYQVDWNASNFSSGVYFYRLEAGDFVSTKKMVLIK